MAYLAEFVMPSTPSAVVNIHGIAAIPACPHGAAAASPSRLHDGVAREERGEVLPAADGPQARPAAAVGNAEGLVEVEVADVGADHPWGGKPQLSIHVRAVHVDLAAVLVDDVADLLNVLLEEGPSGGVGDHEGREGVLVSLAELPEVVDVNAVRVVDPLDLHARHGRGGGIRAVGRPRDDADVPVPLADALLVLADAEEARVFARGPARGLQRAGVEASARDEVLLERVKQLAVALGLGGRRERVHVGDLLPAAGRQ